MREIGWEKLLSEYIAELGSQPFIWGECDCCLAGANWVRRVTGVDIAQRFRGTYDCQKSASAALQKVYKGGVLKAMKKALPAMGFHEVCPLSAQRGDLACARVDAGHAMGIVVGKMVAFKAKSGLVYLPIEQSISAWRVS